MEIKVEGYDMTKEEMTTRIVNLEIEKSALNIKVSALIALLIQNGAIHHEGELSLLYKTFIEEVKMASETSGVDSSVFEKILKNKLGLE